MNPFDPIAKWFFDTKAGEAVAQAFASPLFWYISRRHRQAGRAACPDPACQNH